jgi:serine phosphatase RsbU (regulator of sigma subunit)
VYIRDAQYCYLKWGAVAKVQDVDQRYPKLAALQRRSTDLPSTLTGTITSTSTSTIGKNTNLLDLSTVMKASQAISGEIVLEKLLKQLMVIMVENAGAQKGFLILKKAGKLSIEAAVKGVGNAPFTEDQVPSQNSLTVKSHPVETSRDLSLAIVNYVARTQEYVVLPDASQEGIFSTDPYIITNQPKSILCVPLIKQSKLTGILYVENNLTTNAFTPDRLEVLRLLSAQSAISLENATMYQELEDLNRTLEEKVKERTQKLNQTLEEVEKANTKIMDSIQYAKMIQGSLLPNSDEVKRHLPESFFIWQPRDIIGGDIYFTEFFEDSYLVAVMDCTGHGVPGAFMTMIASSGMKRIIRDEGCHEPGMILKRLNFVVKTLLKQDMAQTLSDDGLDAAICLVKPQEKRLIFAGAKLPLLYIHQGKVKEIKGNRHSIGYKRSDLHFTFTNHSVNIEEDMAFYLLTDGFTDQLGGERGRSFGKRRFKNLLRKHAGEPFETQRERLLQTFTEYKGNYERLDDVTVVGFALK